MNFYFSDIIDDFFNFVKFFFYFFVIVVIIGIIGTIVIFALEHSENRKIEQDRTEFKEKMNKDIALIKKEALKWTDEQKSLYLDDLYSRYNRIKNSDKPWQRSIFVFVIQDDIKHVDLNTQGMYELIEYLEKI